MISATEGASVPPSIISSLAAFVEWYASAAHRDDLRNGCAVAALGTDAGRGDPGLQELFQDQVERYVELLQDLLGEDGDRETALAAMSTLVGALYVSRAVGDEAFSEEILASARRSVLSRRS